jgi:VWFA-related protein
MTRLAAVLAASFAALPLAAGAPQTPVFRSSVDTVIVDVAVHDGRTPIAGLTANDFEVFDNLVPQQILEVTHETVPVDVTMALDTSGSVEGPLLNALIRAVSDVGARMRPDDRATLITFSERIHRRVSLGSGEDVQAAVKGLKAGGSTSLFDALALALVAERPIGRRQMMIVFTDGRDTMSVLSEAALLDTARRADSAIFAVALNANTVVARLRTPPLLTTLTTLTGGRLQELQSGDDLSGSFLRALDEFRASYVVRYVLGGVPRAGWHEINVKVKRPGNLTVRARKGYFGG